MASATASWHDSSSPGNRVASRPSLPVIQARMKRCCGLRARSIPLQRSLLPDVDEPNEKNRHEHQHLTETEERDISDRADIVDERHEARQLLVVDRPRNHEHGLDIEDDEQNRDQIKPDRKSLARVAQGGYA